jgi:predicted ArsR family transcriptional regulator
VVRDSSGFDDQITSLASLGDPVRRSLYLYVARQQESVSRDEAAHILHISRALAAFHLDKLVEEGLLEATYRRLSGKTGPGAGRPSKLYHRSRRELQVQLPPRSYELAARLLAVALSSSESSSSHLALERTARDFGEVAGAEARALAGPDLDARQALNTARHILEGYGFEPVRVGADHEIRLRNCPFHALTAEHRQLICGMNLSLQQGMLSGLQTSEVEAVLDPQPDMCCVALKQKAPN